MKPALLLTNCAHAAPLLIFLLLGCIASGQPYQIKGTVVDKETGEPLVLANLRVLRMFEGGDTLNKLRMGATTGLGGDFLIQGIHLRKCELEASYVGYVTRSLVVDCGKLGTAELCFKLEVAPAHKYDSDPSHPPGVPTYHRQIRTADSSASTQLPISRTSSYQIKGKVVDELTGEPLVVAKVYIAIAYDHRDSLLPGNEVSLGAVTDLYGDFCIRQIPMDVYSGVLTAKYVGFENTTRTFIADSVRGKSLILQMRSDRSTYFQVRDEYRLIDPNITNWQTVISGDWIWGDASRRPGRPVIYQ